MAAEDLTVRNAEGADTGRVLELAHAFWTEDGFPSTPAQVVALEELLTASDFGQIYLFELGGEVVGYAVVGWGYSIEFGGRDGFLDELFITPQARNRGLGARAMALIEADAQARGINALHLELMDDNDRARPFYRRAGYGERRSRMMSKKLWTRRE